MWGVGGRRVFGISQVPSPTGWVSRSAPVARGEFRPGEIRSLISDISRIRSIGYEPQTSIEEGIGRYIEWIRTQGDVEDYFGKAEAGLRAKGIVQKRSSMKLL